MYSTLLLEFSGEIARITLNRPDKRNAINPQMMCDLQTAFDTIEKSHSRLVILTGAGKCFCAGMDLDMLATIAKQSAAENQEDSRRIANWPFMQQNVRRIPVTFHVTIARDRRRRVDGPLSDAPSEGRPSRPPTRSQRA